MIFFLDDDFDDFDLNDGDWDDDTAKNDSWPPARKQPAAAPADNRRQYAPPAGGSYWDDEYDRSNAPRSAAPQRRGAPGYGESDRFGAAEKRSFIFTSSASGRRLISVPVLFLLDAVLIGCALLTFALFHHVIPSAQAPVGEYISAVDPSELTLFTPEETPDDPVSGSEVSTGDAAVSTGDAAEDDLPFTDEVIVTDTSYHSSNVAVTVNSYDENGVCYYVQDIRVRSLDCFRTAFAKDTYGTWVTDSTPSIARSNNAICAINGDFYGASRSKGLVIRNGTFYRGNGNDDDDILVLFADGSMETFSADNYNEEQLLTRDIWQTWSFGPSLLNGDGTAKDHFDSEIAYENPRTALGYYEPGHYCFISVDGRSKASKGLSLVGLAELCQSLGCKIGYNFDGGQTSMMTFGDKVVNKPYKGGRDCSDILYICDPSAE